jgi:hypothetical protein
VPGSPNRLFAFDYGHLTRAGSEYYARKLIAPALSDIVCPARAGSQSFGHEGKAASILQQ